MPIPGGALVVDSAMSGSALVLVVDTTGLSGPVVLVGTSGTTSWYVRGARGTQVATGGTMSFLDPLAPLNAPVVYTLTTDDGTLEAGPVFRSYDGWHLVTDLSSRRAVDFFRLPGDARAPGLRQSVHGIAGRTTPVARHDVSLAESQAQQGITSGADTRLLRTLLGEGAPLVFLHNPDRCRIVDCDASLALVALVTAAPSQQLHNLTSERQWDLAVQPVDDPGADTPAAVATVAQWEAYWSGSTWADFEAAMAGVMVAEFETMVWQ